MTSHYPYNNAVEKTRDYSGYAHNVRRTLIIAILGDAPKYTKHLYMLIRTTTETENFLAFLEENALSRV